MVAALYGSFSLYPPLYQASLHCSVSHYSKSLREALGLDERQVPPYIFQMRTLGYPPGYLKQAEVLHSGLTVYDVKGEGMLLEKFKKNLHISKRKSSYRK